MVRLERKVNQQPCNIMRTHVRRQHTSQAWNNRFYVEVKSLHPTENHSWLTGHQSLSIQLHSTKQFISSSAQLRPEIKKYYPSHERWTFSLPATANRMHDHAEHSKRENDGTGGGWDFTLFQMKKDEVTKILESWKAGFSRRMSWYQDETGW